MSWFRWDGRDLLLQVKVQPRASRDGFAEVLGDAIKVRITAPPVEGKANAHLTAWLARQFRVPKGAVRIESGEGSRHKRVRICNPVQVPPLLHDHILRVKTR